ncbi:MAG: DUF881 domain-containing protein [Nocardioidaceae bacterium]
MPAARSRPEATTHASYVGLLTQITDNTLDADYQTVSERRSGVVAAGKHSNRVIVAAVLAVFGLLLGVSALLTEQNRPLLNAERQELAAQANQRQARLDLVHKQLAQVQTDISRVQQSLSIQNTTEQSLASVTSELGMVTGDIGVHGPGIVITVDNAPQAVGSGGGGIILDSDLQALVNGLWLSGAEAISINGHRLTSLTAIRYAGRAITVDYRSLIPPYVFDVVGDPDTLPAQFSQTQGGQLWLGLEANFGVKYHTVTNKDVSVPADPHNLLRYAKPATGR